jgi:hypothetical protein
MYKTRNLSNCLEESKHINFEQMCNNFKSFISVSQFEGPKTHINQIEKAKIMYNPILHTGAFLYGVNDNGSLTLLGAIIDSGG